VARCRKFLEEAPLSDTEEAVIVRGRHPVTVKFAMAPSLAIRCKALKRRGGDRSMLAFASAAAGRSSSHAPAGILRFGSPEDVFTLKIDGRTAVRRGPETATSGAAVLFMFCAFAASPDIVQRPRGVAGRRNAGYGKTGLKDDVLDNEERVMVGYLVVRSVADCDGPRNHAARAGGGAAAEFAGVAAVSWRRGVPGAWSVTMRRTASTAACYASRYGLDDAMFSRGFSSSGRRTCSKCCATRVCVDSLTTPDRRGRPRTLCSQAAVVAVR
jgi:hypothetical protein